MASNVGKTPRASRAKNKPAVAGSVKSDATLDREASQRLRREADEAAARRDALRRYATKLEADISVRQRKAYFDRHPGEKYAASSVIEAWVGRVCAAAGISCRFDNLDLMIPE